MTKIDDHLHLSLEQYPKTEKMFLSSAENMIPHLKELGIERGIVLSSGEGAAPVMTNDECRAICEKFPDTFSWMCNLDPDKEGDIQQRLHTYKEQGAVGVGEFMMNRRLDDPLIQEIFAAAEKEGLPVLFHMSPQVGFNYGVVDDPGLPLLEECLQKFPNLTIIGHSQPFWYEMSGDAGDSIEERNAWGEGPVVPGGRVPELFDKYPNLYGDLSANSGGCALMRDEEFGLAFLEKNQDRLLFGTDMVNVEMEFPLGKWLDEMHEAGKISTEAYEKVCYKNAQRVFGI